MHLGLFSSGKESIDVSLYFHSIFWKLYRMLFNEEEKVLKLVCYFGIMISGDWGLRALGQGRGSGFGLELFGFTTVVSVFKDAAVCCGCAVVFAPPQGPPGSNVRRLYPWAPWGRDVSRQTALGLTWYVFALLLLLFFFFIFLLFLLASYWYQYQY